ncbi:F-box/LRR-repeat/kelch-repeat protein [Senna tora]|uniref:F-box/LRR-repeat/kelch-repeat protein n=1 Tax=Senna tora TaxID=362788 RepID=A0A834X101_9FABA|nr:F-box/LRR-repeat/kelch-repeat protein [Senna tora]
MDAGTRFPLLIRKHEGQFNGKEGSYITGNSKGEGTIQEKEEDKKQCMLPVPYLPKDCISNIIVRLPYSSLLDSRLVSKQWYNIISSPVFIDAYLRRSESVLIFQTPLPIENYNDFPMASSSSSLVERPRSFSVEEHFQPSFVPLLWQTVPTKKFSLQFVDFKGEKCKKEEYNVSFQGSIRAACNGLILLDSEAKKRKLIVLNPVTRKLIPLPLGTLCPAHKESYGFALSIDTGLYKVVHLFHDELGYASCEILDLKNRIWRAVNGPALGLVKWFGYKPVSAAGALHWVPQIDRNEYIVSLEVHTEKFYTVKLPRSCRTYDRIIEMNGFLGLVIHEEFNQIDIWVLKRRTGEGEEWRKHHSIIVGCLWDMIPLFSSKDQ